MDQQQTQPMDQARRLNNYHVINLCHLFTTFLFLLILLINTFNTLYNLISHEQLLKVTISILGGLFLDSILLIVLYIINIIN